MESQLSKRLSKTKFVVAGLLLGILMAASIEQLSIYRAIQGIGGGALMPIAFTIMYDIFPPEKRGKMTGLFGAVSEHLVYSALY